jgi:hypothetical protein
MEEVGWFQVGGQKVIIADWLNKLFKFLHEKGLSHEGRYRMLKDKRTLPNGVQEVPLTFCTKEEREKAERDWLEYRKEAEKGWLADQYLHGNS